MPDKIYKDESEIYTTYLPKKREERYLIKFISKFDDTAITMRSFTKEEIEESYLAKIKPFVKYDLIPIDYPNIASLDRL